MKKITVILTIFILIFSLGGCSKKDTKTLALEGWDIYINYMAEENDIDYEKMKNKLEKEDSEITYIGLESKNIIIYKCCPNIDDPFTIYYALYDIKNEDAKNITNKEYQDYYADIYNNDEIFSGAIDR